MTSDGDDDKIFESVEKEWEDKSDKTETEDEINDKFQRLNLFFEKDNVGFYINITNLDGPNTIMLWTFSGQQSWCSISSRLSESSTWQNFENKKESASLSTEWNCEEKWTPIISYAGGAKYFRKWYS